jgi:outer membrane receptor protein involved in Fe transport
MGDMTRGTMKTGEALPFMPSARLGGLARWDNGRLSVEGEFRHAFAQDRVPEAVSEDDPSGVATAAYNLVNFSVGWNVLAGDRSSSITLRADNLFDAKYADFAFNPGRNLSLIYKVLF